jgi:hypothetical protein
VRHQRVPALVVGEDPALLLGQHLPPLQAGDDTLERGVEISVGQLLVAAPAGEDRCLVADVRQLGACQTRRLPGDDAQIDVRAERLGGRAPAHNRFPARQVRRRNQHLAVETTRTQQRRIEILDPVRCPDHHHLLRPLESVQLHEQLIQRLILLPVEAMPGPLSANPHPTRR